ncbi:MAG: hypothetical protein PQJ60_06775 [Spirochaetales bacterium]|nr:hypothetical protein [Spirochaetales bacterium]
MFRKMLILPFVCLLFSCGNRGYSLLTVLTDQKDMVLISEYYNKIQDDTRLILIYDDYISLEDIVTEKPDLVIGKDLNSVLFRSNFLPVSLPEGIYPVLSGDLNGKGETELIPLAFDLPVIVYSAGRDDLPLMMDGEDLRREGMVRNRESEGEFVHMGFSPLWNPEFLYWYLRGEKVSFYEDGEFSYDQDRLSAQINDVRDWVEMVNGNLEKERAFSEKYRYIPDYKLLQKGTIDFVPMTFSRYSGLPGKETALMAYSWFGDGEHINPINCLYGGIPKESNYEDRAEQFLRWLVSVEGQKELIQYKGVASPGFALFDRFSSLERINRLHLPLVFSDKLGNRIFLAEQLGTPPLEPENWSAVKGQVLDPWLNETFWKNNTLPLSSYFREWQLQFID